MDNCFEYKAKEGPKKHILGVNRTKVYPKKDVKRCPFEDCNSNMWFFIEGEARICARCGARFTW